MINKAVPPLPSRERVGVRGESASIIILSHNRRDELARTLTRMAATDFPLELIVVDNASTDCSAAMVRDKFPAVTLIANETNRGCGGRNQGLAAAGAEIVITLDDDSDLDPACIPEVVTWFRDHPRVAAVGFTVRDEKGKEEPWFGWEKVGNETDGYLAPAIVTCGAALRKQAVLEIGGFFEPYVVYVEEADLCTRLLGAGWEVRFVPRWVAVHRRADAQRSERRFIHQVTRNTFWYIVRNFAWPTVIWKLTLWKFRSFGLALRRGELWAWLTGWLAAIAGLGPVLKTRRPLTRAAARLADGRFDSQFDASTKIGN